MSPALIAALPFLGALLPGLAIRFGRTAAATAAALATVLALLGLLSHLPDVMAGTAIMTRVDWVPQLGLSASFRIDGLAFVFAALILGIGLLITLYARFYLDPGEDFARFLTYLMLFQGAMTGIVLCDNILMLLIFWELTSLTSFLLIGWWGHLAAGRRGARMALAITGGGGLAMIAGLLILGQIAGSYEISQILHRAEAIQASPLYLPALILICLGAFTKSAQFPFHFWLPQAMAAPTPVSAYLHSATMVKAGIFLLARFWPALSGTPDWTAIVATTGLATLLIGAVIAFFQTDMKALLAYSTISHLGLITFLLGLGTPAAATAAVLHILCHATFKAALFMATGIVDHATHTRDLRRLGGLAGVMPLTFTVVLLASLSMAGLPPLNGFLSKEAMLTEASDTGWIIALLAAFGAAWSVAYALRFLVQGFLGKPRTQPTPPPHDPGAGLLAAPLLLAALVVVTGLFPAQTLGPLVDMAATSVTGAPVITHLQHWHGVTAPALWLSLAAFGLGLALLGLAPRLTAIWQASPRPEAAAIFTATLTTLTRLSRRLAEGLHAPNLPRTLSSILLVILAAGWFAFRGAPHATGLREMTPLSGVALIGGGMLILATLAVPFLHRNRALALLLTGLIGLLLAGAFVLFSAPDLALTQITVEVVAILLMLLGLNFLPRRSPVESRPLRRLRDGVLATLAGLGAGALAYALMMRDAAFPGISAFHWAQSKPGAGGTNAVNTIIVDFRGYDTFGEIIVLGIAALVIFALADTLLRSPAAVARLRSLDTGGNAGGAHPAMLVVGTRFLLPLAMTVAFYIFLRGHNLPGGGFVAGLIVSIGLLLQYLASGYVWSDRQQRLNPHALIAAGVLVACVAGAGAWIFGLPFLTSGYTYIHLPLIGEVELATAILFDLGVFLCVLGAVVLAIASLSRLAQRTPDADPTAKAEVL